jgi:nucleotide-binding universal stress UspA family protein
MYRRILVATDGSDLASKGLDHAIELARQLSAELVVLTVTPPWTPIGVEGTVGWTYDPVDEYDTASAEAARQILAAAVAKAAASGIAATSVHLPGKYPADGIVEVAQQQACDMIVMASHGRRGLGRLVLGSQTTSVVTHAKVPVLVVR